MLVTKCCLDLRGQEESGALTVKVFSFGHILIGTLCIAIGGESHHECWPLLTTELLGKVDMLSCMSLSTNDLRCGHFTGSAVAMSATGWGMNCFASLTNVGPISRRPSSKLSDPTKLSLEPSENVSSCAER